ncbi:MAG TPA: DUF4232 domain-containing protein [Solirubrobacteraceae bacterium]|nr:DUF4232 domain-containing protein [Solirubrobacteraceae bacterium]
MLGRRARRIAGTRSRPGLVAGICGLGAIAGGAVCLTPPALGASAPARCRATALTGKVVTPFDGAAGTFGTVVVLTNKAAKPCFVSGRPKIALYSAGGAHLAGTQSSTAGAIHRVTLAHGGRAGATLRWHGSPDEPGPISAQCDQVKSIRVTPTGAGGHVTIGGTALGGGLQICDPPGAFSVGALSPPPFSP